MPGTVTTAQIALADAVYAIDRPFSYRVPDTLTEQVLPGIRVLVPFGAGNRKTEGLVLSVSEGPEPERILKTILSVLDDAPVLDEQAIRLAIWMRERYFCTVYDAVKAILPSGLFFSLKDTLVLEKGISKENAYFAAEHSTAAKRLLDLLYSC